MIVISNTSPLIALSRINQLSILKHLFQKVYIPEFVFQESVLQSNVAIQKENIAKAIAEEFIMVAKSQTVYTFQRNLDFGERDVINLAFDKQAYFLIIDKKARNEAKELGFKVLKTSTLIKRAEMLNLISSYSDIINELEKIKIYLPKY